MSTLDPLPNCWRLSRYEPALRGRDSRWESWTGYSDVGKEFNGITLTSEEYLRVENLYIDAVTRFAGDAAADVFRVVYIGHQQTGFGLSAGQRLLLSDLGPVVRGNLRETLDCALEGVEGTFQVEFGFDLYIHLAAVAPCERAIVESDRAGLHVEAGVPLVLWEN